MANPGPYPQMPPGNPAMAGPPMGAMPMPRPARQGTSRAVPVVVSAGLAVGVFCGLLFGLGTDRDEASASTTASNGVKSSNDDSSGTPATPDKPKTDKPPDKPAAGSAAPANGSAAPANGSAAPAAGSAAPANGSAAPANGSASTTQPAAGSASAPAKAAKLILDIKPDPGPQAKITVDGKDVTGTTFDVDLGTEKTKTVKVAITAPGFHSYEQKVEVKGDTTVNVELAKRAATYVHPVPPNNNGTPPVKPTGKDGKGGKKGGGVIDL